jgi:hypothetical protein
MDNISGRLVIVIDELDRCRPSFALEILEKIKHLFSVKNVVFLLVMNKQQLEEAIKSVYGANIDAHTYLQKFINVETSIPKRVTDRYSNDIDLYIKNLIQLHEIETWGDDSFIADLLIPLAKHFNLSLRQLEKVFTNLAIIYSTSGQHQLRPVHIIVFISVVKVVNPNVFGNLLLGRISFTTLCEHLGLHQLNVEAKDKASFIGLMDWVRLSLLSESEYQGVDENAQIRNLENKISWFGLDRKKLVPIFCEKLSMFNVN